MSDFDKMFDAHILELSSQYGTINDFGKTFFTDDELIDFARAILKPEPISIGAEASDIKEFKAGIYGDKND